MWEINNNEQIVSFLLSVMLGTASCLIYDIIRARRKIVKPPVISVLVTDLVCFISGAFFCFCFLLAYTAGEPRVYVFIGIAFGFAVCRRTLSRFVFKMFLRFFRAVNNKKIKISGTYKKCLVFFDCKSDEFFRKTAVFIKNCKKGEKNS